MNAETITRGEHESLREKVDANEKGIYQKLDATEKEIRDDLQDTQKELGKHERECEKRYGEIRTEFAILRTQLSLHTKLMVGMVMGFLALIVSEVWRILL